MSALPFSLPAPLIAVIAALLVFAVALLALGAHNRRREEYRVGLGLLRSLKWGEFANHVVAVLGRRGLVQDGVHRRPGEEGFHLSMVRAAARYLVQCKQGDGSNVSVANVRELAAMVELHGAEGGIFVTTGTVDAAARRRAGMSGIELLAGRDLWRQLRPLLPLDLREEVDASARQRRRQRLLAAVGAGVLAGATAWALLLALPQPGPAAGNARTLDPTAPHPGTTAAPVQPAPGPRSNDPLPSPPADPGAAQGAAAGTVAGAGAGTTAAGSAATAPPPAAAARPTGIAVDPNAPASGADPAANLPAAAPAMPDPTLDAGQRAARRAEAERNVRQLPGVEGASWTTHSTMLLELGPPTPERSHDQVIASACTQLVRFEELRFSRLQLQAPATPGEPPGHVRWRQCR